ncbi:MAG: hypothetical protein QG639_603 [Patescibacteria group bacterium]|nr:hypothetical protein [Patescibacteria group bacterium]
MRSTYYFFLGTAAEYIKMMPVIRAFKQKKLPFKVIASGQNDITRSELHSDSGISNIDITLTSKPITPTPLGLGWWWITTFFKGYALLNSEFSDKRPVCIVHGDTVSTLLGACLAKSLGAQVAHVEAGLRSYNFFSPFPEEINRVLTSRLANFHYSPNQWAMHNLRSVSGKKINTQGNTLMDSMQIALRKQHSKDIKKIKSQSKYFLAVIHRQENVLNKETMTQLISLIAAASKKKRCVFILHSLTKKYLAEYNLLPKLSKNKNITCVDRVPYADMMYLMSHASFIITDGGSNQEETYYLGIPTLVLRKNTERIEGLGRNVVMSGLQLDVMRDFINHFSRYVFPKVKPSISPSKIIANSLALIK